MRRATLLPLRVFFLSVAAWPVLASPNDGTGDYAMGNYRNLFAEGGRSQKEIAAKIDAAHAEAA